MITYTSNSTVKPIEWDIESSPTTVYHNYNVQQIEVKEDIENGTESRTEYEYATDKMTHQEYNIYITKRLNSLQDITNTLVLDSLESKGAII